MSIDVWQNYVETLPWQPGQLDEASYCAFLRAGSLGVDAVTALNTVAARIAATSGRIRARKLECQLARAYRHAASNSPAALAQLPGNLYPKQSAWPAVDVKMIKRIASTGFGLYDLWEGSPVRFDDGPEPHTEQVIDALYPGNPLLCVGRTTRKFNTESRQYWRGSLAQYQFIVPCCMTAKAGLTLEGKESPHSLENTGPRRFLVVEFDSGPLDEQAALIDHLAQRGPLALVLYSGGKSLHCWFPCTGIAEEVLRRFMVLGRRLGADLTTWRDRHQFVRMPDGVRNDGARQTIYYFNPEVL